MKYNGLTYLIGEGFSNALKNKKATAASIASMLEMNITFSPAAIPKARVAGAVRRKPPSVEVAIT